MRKVKWVRPYLVAGDTPGRTELERQLAVLGRPHTEPHQLYVACVWRLEPAPCFNNCNSIQCCKFLGYTIFWHYMPESHLIMQGKDKRGIQKVEENIREDKCEMFGLT